MNDRKNLWPNYAPAAVEFKYGMGSYLYTEDNTKYLDYITGIAVNSLGHNHSELVAALKSQTTKVWHLSNMFRIAAAEKAAARLAQLSCGDNVFFSNSGTESIEAAIKAARKYQYNLGKKHCYNIIGFEGSFHGRSIAAVAASGNKSYCEGFVPFDYGFKQCRWQDIAQLETIIDASTAAVIIEPVQGEGGVRMANADFIQRLAAICKAKGVLLIFDEVQCGIYRTGKLFCYQHYDIEPDIIALAKGLGCGFPVGACITKKAIGDAMVIGSHGSTFGGNPLAMAVVNAVLDVMAKDEFVQQLTANIDYLWSQLQQLQQDFPNKVLELSGTGMMVGILTDKPNIEVVKAMRANKILVGKSGNNLVRLLPPLNTNSKEIDKFIAVFKQVVCA